MKTLHITIIALLSITLLSSSVAYANPDLIAELEAKIAELEATITGLETNVTELKEDKQNKNAKFDKLKDRLENKIAELESKVDNKNTKIAEFEEIVETKDAKIDHLKEKVDRKIANKQEKVGIAQDDLNAQSSEIESLKATLQNQTAIIESMKTQMSEMTDYETDWIHVETILNNMKLEWDQHGTSSVPHHSLYITNISSFAQSIFVDWDTNGELEGINISGTKGWDGNLVHFHDNGRLDRHDYLVPVGIYPESAHADGPIVGPVERWMGNITHYDPSTGEVISIHCLMKELEIAKNRVHVTECVK